jgi:hypothetical protein
MKKISLLKYAFSGVSIGLSAGALIITSRLDLPQCNNDKVISTVIALWKLNALRSDQLVEDGRLKEPLELPLKIASGRTCSAEIYVSGKANGSVSYTVMRPLKGAANMVTID